MTTVSYRNIKVDDIQVFYREAGEQHAQTLVLLHGFPSSSHMFRNLLPVLGERFHGERAFPSLARPRQFLGNWSRKSTRLHNRVIVKKSTA